MLNKNYFNLYNSWRSFDLITCVLALVGLALAVADYELSYRYEPKEVDTRGIESAKNSTLRLLTSVFTLLAIISIFLRHGLKAKWLNELTMIAGKKTPTQRGSRFLYLLDGGSFLRRRRHRTLWSWSLVLEILLVFIQPIPYYDLEVSFYYLHSSQDIIVRTVYTLGDFLYALMFLRLFLLVRTLFNYSKYTDAYAKRVCEHFGFTANTRFCFKCYIVRHPLLTVICTFIFTMTLLAFTLRVFERPYYNEQSL